MKMVKTLMAASIAASLFGTAAAQAATVTNHGSGTTTFGRTVVNESDLDPVDLPEGGANVWSIVLGATENLSVDDSVTLTLTNGATWNAIASNDLLANGNTDFSLVSNTDPAVAIFRVTTAVPGGETLTLAATANVDLTGVTASGSSQISTAMSGFVGGVATSLYGSPLTFNAFQLAPMMTAAITTTQTGTFDVATGFTELTAATSSDAGSPFDSSLVGTVTVTTNAAATTSANGTTVGTPTAGPSAGTTLFTLAGPMGGVSTVTSAGLTGSTSAGAATSPATPAGQMAVDSANNVAYAVDTAGAGAHTITLNFDGTTVQDASTYTMAVSRLTDGTNYSAGTVSSAATMFTFTRNGSSFTTNSFGPLNRIQVTDRSGAIGTGGADGAITLTAYDSDGGLVTCSGLSIDNVPNNGTSSIEGSDVVAACPDVKRVEGIVNSTSILVSNVKNTESGTTVTPALSGSAAGTAAQ